MTLYAVALCIYFTHHPPQPGQCFMISNPRGFHAREECEAELDRLRRLKAHGQLLFDPIDSHGSTKGMSQYSALSCETFQRVN
ncbi:hypothetical protein ACVILI_003871 [Mesorhizobium sp. USDA 4775]